MAVLGIWTPRAIAAGYVKRDWSRLRREFPSSRSQESHTICRLTESFVATDQQMQVVSKFAVARLHRPVFLRRGQSVERTCAHRLYRPHRRLRACRETQLKRTSQRDMSAESLVSERLSESLPLAYCHNPVPLCAKKRYIQIRSMPNAAG